MLNIKLKVKKIIKTKTIYIGNPPIPVHIRRNSRAKRYSLRIGRDNRVYLTLPKAAALCDAVAFADSKQEWLRQVLTKCKPLIAVTFGIRILFDGKEVLIQKAYGQSHLVQLKNNCLHISTGGGDNKIAMIVQNYFKSLARERFKLHSNSYANQLGCQVGGITVRDTRSRWGSCTSKGNLMYSWRLIMAPLSVQKYIAVHEVCHLIEMNHSAAYWALVARLLPDYKSSRMWLKHNAQFLHRYQF